VLDVDPLEVPIVAQVSFVLHLDEVQLELALEAGLQLLDALGVNNLALELQVLLRALKFLQLLVVDQPVGGDDVPLLSDEAE